MRSGERAGCWTLVNSDVVRPISAETLAKIKDGKTMPDGASEGQEFDALCEVLVQTWYTSPAAFEKAGRKDLSFAQLFHNPDQYRGAVVHIDLEHVYRGYRLDETAACIDRARRAFAVRGACPAITGIRETTGR